MADPRKPTPHPPADHDNAPAACVDDLLRELTELRSSLEHSHRLATLGTITGSIAHEFNNILTPVLAYAEAALADPDDRKLVGRALEQAALGAQRASRIAAAILAFARPGGGGVPRGTDGVSDVGRVVRETLLCLGHERGGGPGRITVETEVEKGLAAAVDPAVLQQVLMNLLLNAFAAMKRSGGVVKIGGRWVGGEAVRSTWNAAEHGWVVVSVADTGPGIHREVIGRIFEPWGATTNGKWQMANGKSGGEGTGLGLSICRGMVEGAGGWMEVESEEGSGARFTVVVPAAQR